MSHSFKKKGGYYPLYRNYNTLKLLNIKNGGGQEVLAIKFYTFQCLDILLYEIAYVIPKLKVI